MLVLCIRKIVRRDHRKDFVSLIYLYSVPQRIYTTLVKRIKLRPQNEEVIDQQITEQLAEQKRCWEHEQLVLSCLRRELDKKMPGIQRQVAQLRQEIAENEEAIDELLLMKAMINRRKIDLH